MGTLLDSEDIIQNTRLICLKVSDRYILTIRDGVIEGFELIMHFLYHAAQLATCVVWVVPFEQYIFTPGFFRESQ